MNSLKWDTGLVFMYRRNFFLLRNPFLRIHKIFFVQEIRSKFGMFLKHLRYFYWRCFLFSGKIAIYFSIYISHEIKREKHKINSNGLETTTKERTRNRNKNLCLVEFNFDLFGRFLFCCFHQMKKNSDLKSESFIWRVFCTHT